MNLQYFVRLHAELVLNYNLRLLRCFCEERVRVKPGVSVTLTVTRCLFHSKRLRHAPLIARWFSSKRGGKEGQRCTDVSRWRLINTLSPQKKKQKKTALAAKTTTQPPGWGVFCMSRPQFVVWQRANMKQLIIPIFLHGCWLGNKLSRLITGSMNFNIAFWIDFVWHRESAPPGVFPASGRCRRTGIFFFFLNIFCCFSSPWIAAPSQYVQHVLSGTAAALKVQGLRREWVLEWWLMVHKYGIRAQA